MNTVKEKCQYFYFEIVERMCLRSSSMKTDLKNFLVDKFIAGVQQVLNLKPIFPEDLGSIR